MDWLSGSEERRVSLSASCDPPCSVRRIPCMNQPLVRHKGHFRDEGVYDEEVASKTSQRKAN